MSIAAKLARVAQACAYVQKDKRNDYHRYSYASAAAVLDKVNDAMSEHGLCSTVRVEVVSSEAVQTAQGKPERLVTVRVYLTIHDGETEETLTTEGVGSGSDSGDKAVMKAQTAAIKYAWLLCLNISTGDDPEADMATDIRNDAQPAKTAPTSKSQPENQRPEPTLPADHPLLARAKQVWENIPKDKRPSEHPRRTQASLEAFIQKYG